MLVEQIMAESIEQREIQLERKRRYREKEDRDEMKLTETGFKERAERDETKPLDSAELFIAKPVTPPDLEKDDSLELLRKSYAIDGHAQVRKYRVPIPRNKIISKYIDDVEVSPIIRHSA